MCVEEEAKFFEGAFHFECGVAEAMFPGEDFLLLVVLGMHFDTIGTQWFEAVHVDAEVGYFFSGVFKALQP